LIKHKKTLEEKRARNLVSEYVDIVFYLTITQLQ